MVLNRWTMFQAIIIVILMIVGFTIDIFNKDIGVPFSGSDGINTQVLLTMLILVFVIGLLSLLMYFQTKKSDMFLKHKLWEKMHVVTPIILIISLVLILIAFLIDPLNNFIQTNRWIIYILGYYILFLMNLTVLAIIHKLKKKTISNDSKIMAAFFWTSLSLLIIIFVF